MKQLLLYFLLLGCVAIVAPPVQAFAPNHEERQAHFTDAEDLGTMDVAMDAQLQISYPAQEAVGMEISLEASYTTPVDGVMVEMHGVRPLSPNIDVPANQQAHQHRRQPTIQGNRPTSDRAPFHILGWLSHSGHWYLCSLSLAHYIA